MERHSKHGLPSIVLSMKLEYFGGSLILAVLYRDKVLHYRPNFAVLFLTEQWVISEIILLKQHYVSTYDMNFYLNVYSSIIYNIYSYTKYVLPNISIFFLSLSRCFIYISHKKIFPLRYSMTCSIQYLLSLLINIQCFGRQLLNPPHPTFEAWL